MPQRLFVCDNLDRARRPDAKKNGSENSEPCFETLIFAGAQRPKRGTSPLRMAVSAQASSHRSIVLKSRPNSVLEGEKAMVADLDMVALWLPGGDGHPVVSSSI
jgi:hypothetical protein